MFQFITHFTSSYTTPFTAISFSLLNLLAQKKLIRGWKRLKTKFIFRFVVVVDDGEEEKVSQSSRKWNVFAAFAILEQRYHACFSAHEKCMKQKKLSRTLNCSWKCFLVVPTEIRFGSSDMSVVCGALKPPHRCGSRIPLSCVAQRFNHRSFAWTWRCPSSKGRREAPLMYNSHDPKEKKSFQVSFTSKLIRLVKSFFRRSFQSLKSKFTRFSEWLNSTRTRSFRCAIFSSLFEGIFSKPVLDTRGKCCLLINIQQTKRMNQTEITTQTTTWRDALF